MHIQNDSINWAQFVFGIIFWKAYYILKSLLKFMYDNLMEIAYLIETTWSLEYMSHLVFKLAVYTDTRHYWSYNVRNLSRSCATMHIRAIEFQRWPVAINKVARWVISPDFRCHCREILWKFRYRRWERYRYIRYAKYSPLILVNGTDRVLLSRIRAYCFALFTSSKRKKSSIHRFELYIYSLFISCPLYFLAGQWRRS